MILTRENISENIHMYVCSPPGVRPHRSYMLCGWHYWDVTLNLYTAAILVFLNLRYQNECLEKSWVSPQWGCLWNVSSPLKRTTRNCLEKLSQINVTCSCSCQRLLGKSLTLTHSLVRRFSKWAFFSFRRILTWKRNATNRDEEEKTRSQEKKGFC